jgi:hypothetical protein
MMKCPCGGTTPFGFKPRIAVAISSTSSKTSVVGKLAMVERLSRISKLQAQLLVDFWASQRQLVEQSPSDLVRAKIFACENCVASRNSRESNGRILAGSKCLILQRTGNLAVFYLPLRIPPEQLGCYKL